MFSKHIFPATTGLFVLADKKMPRLTFLKPLIDRSSSLAAAVNSIYYQ